MLDGGDPVGGVIGDSKGNLHGVGTYGGKGTENCAPHCGVLFELVQNKSDSWSEKTNHFFDSSSTDGFTPAGGLVRDAHGNIYGTTSGGGQYGGGTIYEMTAAGAYGVL